MNGVLNELLFCKVKEYAPDFKTGLATEVPLNDSLAKKAMAYYQTAAWLIKHKYYNKN